MRKFILAGFTFLAVSSVFGQTILTDDDMPHSGDSARFSVASQLLVQPGGSGANQTWDFSDLTSASQYVNNFVSVSSTAFTYQLLFTLGPSSSNVAMADPNGINIPAQTGVSLSDVFNFYKRSSSEFSQTGFGASVQGFPVPVAYSSKDNLYPLPLAYQGQSTSNYRYQVDIPTIGYYGRKAIRNNEVDGFGTLILPTGTYDALRVRSVLQATDSIALDTFNLGFNLPYPDEIHYKYVAKGFGWPLLEITASEVFGFEVVTRIVFRDTLIRDEVTGVEDVPFSSLDVYPNPASEFAVVRTELLKTTDLSYSLFDATGRKVFEQHRRNQQAGTCVEWLNLTALNLADGLYFVKVQPGNTKAVIRPLLVHNH